ncbi:M10 family metallopeptidase C-terminal domain-containing protein, partial [bacterium]|nr:M10 family metallopeptidase C-terminal domain-containing protein [bacterium]
MASSTSQSQELEGSTSSSGSVSTLSEASSSQGSTTEGNSSVAPVVSNSSDASESCDAVSNPVVLETSSLEELNSAPNFIGAQLLEEPAPGLDDQSLSLDKEILHSAGCSCAVCQGDLSDRILKASDGSEDSLAATYGTGTLNQLADYLETGFWSDWGEVSRNFNLSSTGTSPNSGVLTYNTSGNSQDSNGLNDPDRASLVDEAFKLFEATLGIDFQLTTASGSDFRFGDAAAGAYASYSRSGSTINYANININDSWNGWIDGFGNYTFQTVLHEIGHGLGLGHQSNYNGSATYPTDADFTNDSWQASMMSYFSPTDNTSIDASFAYLSTPMVADWIALDEIYSDQGYGIANAFSGDTTYGFNTTISAATSGIFNELKDWIPTTAFTVVDGGGDDTLDFSGFPDAQLIDLRPSDASATNVYASNIAGKTGNLTIAPGTLIEAAIGGSGNDEIRGNASNNQLDGGLGTDTALFSGSYSDYSFLVVGNNLKVSDLRSGSPDGVDTLS